MKTPLTQLHEFIREKKPANDAILNKIVELFEVEKFQLMRAYLGFFNPEITNDQFRSLMDEAEQYYTWQYLSNESKEKNPGKI